MLEPAWVSSALPGPARFSRENNWDCQSSQPQGWAGSAAKDPKFPSGAARPRLLVSHGALTDLKNEFSFQFLCGGNEPIPGFPCEFGVTAGKGKSGSAQLWDGDLG